MNHIISKINFNHISKYLLQLSLLFFIIGISLYIYGSFLIKNTKLYI